MRLNDIPTPPCSSWDKAGRGSDNCWIVKSVWEHASLGMDDDCVVNGYEATRARIETSLARYGGEWFAEQFVDGREFNISILRRLASPAFCRLRKSASQHTQPAGQRSLATQQSGIRMRLNTMRRHGFFQTWPIVFARR